MKITEQVNGKEHFGPESCIPELAIIGWRTQGTRYDYGGRLLNEEERQ